MYGTCTRWFVHRQCQNVGCNVVHRVYQFLLKLVNPRCYTLYIIKLTSEFYYSQDSSAGLDKVTNMTSYRPSFLFFFFKFFPYLLCVLSASTVGLVLWFLLNSLTFFLVNALASISMIVRVQHPPQIQKLGSFVDSMLFLKMIVLFFWFKILRQYLLQGLISLCKKFKQNKKCFLAFMPFHNSAFFSLCPSFYTRFLGEYILYWSYAEVVIYLCTYRVMVEFPKQLQCIL